MSNSNAGDSCPSQISEICKRRHWGMYWLIIFISIGTLCGRVATMRNIEVVRDVETNERIQIETPFFSANDRSRWCTIRSLVDHGTYEIDEVIANEPGAISWNTIDKVQHLGPDGELHFYSSKPPLLPTLMAGKYWLVKAISGQKLQSNALGIVRIVLLLCNIVPYFIFLILLATMLERIVVHDWTRYYVLSAAGFGTFLTTFSVTLNNHLPAAVCVMAAIYCLDRIYRTGAVCHDQCEAGWLHYVCAGLFAAFAAAIELPALSFFACAAGLCLLKSPGKTILGFGAGAILVAAGFFGTNYLAHQTWKPAYANRADGELLQTVSGDYRVELCGTNDERLDDGRVPESILKVVQDHVTANGIPKLAAPYSEQSFWRRDRESKLGRWAIRDRVSNQRFTVEETKPSEFAIRQWGNWYDYSNSYWASGNRSNVDQGEPDQLKYAFHMLFGHHGIFSLTPIWLFSMAGCLALLFTARLQLKWLGLLGLATSIVVFGFYVQRPVIDRNYGGWTSALRWMFWLIPIWLVAMVPVVDSLGKKPWGKIFCLVLLAVSIASALYSVTNPWTHPWLYEIWESFGLER